ncbi:hypothetical protein Bca4012_103371 [Brassica carinata]
MGENQVEGDQSTSEADGANDPTEVGLVGSIGAKRKEPTDGNFLRPGGKIQKRSRGPSPLSPKEIALPPLAAALGRDSPLASDPDACAEFVRRIRGGAHLMPETSELAFQMGLSHLLRPTWKMASNFAKAEAAIESKDAEIEKSKRVTLDKAKEMIAERSRYHREHKQDAEIIKGLEGELEAARSKIDRLEAEKTEEAEKTKRTMDHLRQVHRRELTSEMCCIGVAAADRFDKFRRYMVDRDKREEKLVLHSQAFELWMGWACWKSGDAGRISCLPTRQRFEPVRLERRSNVEVADPLLLRGFDSGDSDRGTIGAAAPASKLCLSIALILFFRTASHCLKAFVVAWSIYMNCVFPVPFSFSRVSHVFVEVQTEQGRRASLACD